MTSEPSPSFSRARKWSLSANLLLAFAAMAALVLMVNYLAARHFTRWSWFESSQARLAPLSLQVLNSVTNPVKVTLYFDKEDPLYRMSWNLLKTYRYANSQIQVEVIDYINEPAAAQVFKRKYSLGDADRDLILFDHQSRLATVYQSELSDIDIQSMISGRSKEARRTNFKGEALFTASILNVISARQVKAYFLDGHGEHDPESDDGMIGYSRFAQVLRENNVLLGKLRLEGPVEIPADCTLLIIPGPRTAMSSDVLEKIDRYLKQGRRLFALFFPTVGTEKESGLEKVLSQWGVSVGSDVVIDEKNSVSDRKDLVTSTFGTHEVVKPLLHGFQLYLVLPRSVSKNKVGTSGSDAPQVEQLVYTSAAGRLITDIRKEQMIPSVKDFIGNIPVMASVEKGGIRNVTADRGTTRIVVTGESLFLNNDNIDREANHQFASHAINWLLARNDLIAAVPPRPLNEYKLTMTEAQMSAARWILMGAFPGSVLFLGALVWLRRRR